MTESDLRTTLNLPKTDFPMKANLPQAEPRRLARWKEVDLYGQLRKARTGRPSFVLHDGPPYANGHIHIGHDPQQGAEGRRRAQPLDGGPRRPLPARAGTATACRSSSRSSATSARRSAEMSARRHPPGLPRLRRQVHAHPARGVRAAGRHRRVGGSLPHDGAGLRGHDRAPARRRSSRRGSSTRPRSRSTGASRAAPRWRRPRSSTTRTTRARRSTCASRSRRAKRPGSPPAPRARGPPRVCRRSGPPRPGRCRPTWRIAFHPEADYAFFPVEGRDEVLLVAKALAEARGEALRPDARGAARRGQGCGARARQVPAPLDRPRLAGRPGRLRDARHRHRRRAHGARPRLGRLPHGRRATASTSTARSTRPAASCPRCERFAGQQRVGRQPARRRAAARAGRPRPGGQGSRTATRTAGAASTRSSSARPSSGSSPSTRAAPRCASRRSPRSTATRWLPGWGEERIHNMIATRPDWCISRQRAVGRADPGLLLQGLRQGPAAARPAAPRRGRLRAGERRRLVRARGRRTCCPRASPARTAAATEFDKERDILDVWFDSGSLGRGGARDSPGPALALRRLPRGQRPAPRLVPLVAADRRRHARARPLQRRSITHGFVVDGEGRKMSKSLGNDVDTAQDDREAPAPRSCGCGRSWSTTARTCGSPTT